MHELAIAQSMIEMAERHARQAGAARVTRLRCRVGALCQVDDALLRDAFEIAREGTACEYAAVCIEHCPLTAICHTGGNGWR
ncbi:MAG: hydrogenase maturation nickel metallochaperone HypA [Phycisphaerales bacterium]|nr:hydrogenase maturation nickel metallochaperone HypA [Phycisphaerales bacterium]